MFFCIDAIPTEDKAVTVLCAKMGWRMPKNWRAVREEMKGIHVIYGLPLMDLADWDRQQQQCKEEAINKNANESSTNASGNVNIKVHNAPCNNNNGNDGKNYHVVHVEEEEEKKDSTEEYVC